MTEIVPPGRHPFARAPSAGGCVDDLLKTTSGIVHGGGWRRAPEAVKGRDGMDVLLDSCILIDHFNGVTAATDYLKQTQTSARVSAITRAEVLTDSSHARQAAFASWTVSSSSRIRSSVADLAADLRRSPHWKLPPPSRRPWPTPTGCAWPLANTRESIRSDAFVAVPYKLGPNGR